ncbi:MAG: hypothetical protein Q8N55_04355 [bacterium]|nr:hypothetical protein [bacterium]
MQSLMCLGISLRQSAPLRYDALPKIPVARQAVALQLAKERFAKR